LFWVDPVNDLTAVLFVQEMPFYGKLHKSFRDGSMDRINPGKGGTKAFFVFQGNSSASNSYSGA
jgi:hypothetical protein